MRMEGVYNITYLNSLYRLIINDEHNKVDTATVLLSQKTVKC